MMTEKEKPTEVADNVVVVMDYSLTIEGEIVDMSDEGDPLPYLHGHENIVPGLERELTGLKVGDTKKVAVEPKDGYGEYDEEGTVFVDKLEIPGEIPLELGVELHVTDEEGDSTHATIVWIGADEVKLDFNHPLAGKTLEFFIKIIELRHPTEEELAHGHVHGEGGHQH
jgi:FKBP-type peptidyl-prolyl cis-trans isomerase SlyD